MSDVPDAPDYDVFDDFDASLRPKKQADKPEKFERSAAGDEAAAARQQAQAEAAQVAEATKIREAKAVQKIQARPGDARLAQIVNLHIAGYSLEQIAGSLGTTAAEIDKMLANEVARYIKSQPQLRVYVRNWVSNRYALLLEAMWDDATDSKSPYRFEANAQALRILDRMSKLHGAEAPVQSEVKVEAAPENVERMMAMLQSQTGMAYDTDIFDAEIVEDTVAQSAAALEVSGNRIEQEDDEDG